MSFKVKGALKTWRGPHAPELWPAVAAAGRGLLLRTAGAPAAARHARGRLRRAAGLLGGPSAVPWLSLGCETQRNGRFFRGIWA